MATNFLTGQTSFLSDVDAAYQKAEQEARGYVDYLTQNNLLWRAANQSPPAQGRQEAENALKDRLFQTALAQSQSFYVNPLLSQFGSFLRETNIEPIAPYGAAPTNARPTVQPPTPPAVRVDMSWFNSPSLQNQPAFQQGVQAYGSVSAFKSAQENYNRAYAKYLVDYAEEQANLGLLGTARAGNLASVYQQASQNPAFSESERQRYASLAAPLQAEQERMDQGVQQYSLLQDVAGRATRGLYDQRTALLNTAVQNATALRDQEYAAAQSLTSPVQRFLAQDAAETKYQNTVNQANQFYEANTQYIQNAYNQILGRQLSPEAVALPFGQLPTLPTREALQQAVQAEQVAAQQAEAQRLAQAEAQRVAAQQAEAQRLAQEEAQRVAAQQAEAQRLAAQQAAQAVTPPTPVTTTPAVTPPLAATPVTTTTPPLAAPTTTQATPPLATPVTTTPAQPSPVTTTPTTPSFLGGIPVGISAQPTQTGNLPMATALSTENLPPLRSSGGGGASAIDPTLRPYLELGLRAAEQQFLQTQPQFFPGQTYVSPSQQTLDALAAQEQLARQAPATLQAAQESYMRGLGGLGATASGAFLAGNPFQQQMIQAATRPIMQQFEEQTLPGIASGFSQAGRYGSGAMERALGRATESTARAIGDVSTNIAFQDYGAERGRQQQAILGQITAAGQAPQIYGQQFLPSQQLAQIGAAREQIAGLPLQEQMQRFQFAQQAPRESLSAFLSSVYGTPLAGSQYAPTPQAQTNRFGSTLGGAATGAGIGYMIGGATGAGYGAALGTLGGLLL